MVYYYHSAIPGAPVLSGTAGALKNVLKTLLFDGFGTTGVTSIVVASNVATVTFSGTNPFNRDIPMLIAGATPAGLNGLQKVLSITSTTATFATSGIADGSATGTITAKVPGAGWTEVFSGTNLTALKPSAVEATGMLLRVDDTGTTSARVVGYESMTDISAGVNAIPTDAMLAGGGYWGKSQTSDSAARPWVLVADERGFHLAIAPGTSGLYCLRYAGDIVSDKSGDAWGWMLSAGISNDAGDSDVSRACNAYTGRAARNGAYLARRVSGIGGAVDVQRIGAAQNGSADAAYSGSPNYSMIGGGLNAANNGLLLARVELIESGRRGTIPGLWHARGDLALRFQHGQIIDGTDDLAGRRLLAMRCGAAWSFFNQPFGTAFIDLTGPWR